LSIKYLKLPQCQYHNFNVLDKKQLEDTTGVTVIRRRRDNTITKRKRTKQ